MYSNTCNLEGADATVSAQRIMDRCEILGKCSEEPGLLVRRFASPAMKEVNELVALWMQAAGMSTHMDQIGNLIGRYEASGVQAKTLLLGSHLDTVRNAGKYDGTLGVLIALSVVERLHQRGKHLPFALEVLGFADEEGLRYQETYLGSKTLVGTIDSVALDLLDNEGIQLAEALRSFGGDPENLHRAKRDSGDLLGYCEVHIEQGPVLEMLNLPVGLVSAIAGRSFVNVSFAGEAGHAGTVPMKLRRDALCASAEFILAVETYARTIPGLTATIGQFTAEPGASNVIPGLVTLSLDIRHQEDALRTQATQHYKTLATDIAKARSIVAAWRPVQEYYSIHCTPRLARLLGKTIQQIGIPLHVLPSGAGHDAVVLSELTDVAMLFVRCRGGISHHPAELVTLEDVAVALHVLENFLYVLAEEGESS